MNLTLSYDAVTTKNGQPVTTSLEVAKYFGKNHKNVLRDIENLGAGNRLKFEPISPQIREFFERNFWVGEYTDEMNRKQILYHLTKDGFTLLVMGYTGERAMLFKIAYINAFNHMTATLREAETYFTRKARAALRDKFPNMEPVRNRFKLCGNTVQRISRELGIHESTVRRNLKQALHWGLMTEDELRRARQDHREFQKALKYVMQQKLAF